MAQLIFYCPYTNRPIRSGVEIDSRAAKEMGKYPVSLYCPHCNTLHHGFIADGSVMLDTEFKPGRENPKTKN